MDFAKDVIKYAALGALLGLVIGAVHQALSEPIVCADCGAPIR